MPRPQDHLEAALQLARELPRDEQGRLTPDSMKVIEAALAGAGDPSKDSPEEAALRQAIREASGGLKDLLGLEPMAPPKISQGEAAEETGLGPDLSTAQQPDLLSGLLGKLAQVITDALDRDTSNKTTDLGSLGDRLAESLHKAVAELLAGLDLGGSVPIESGTRREVERSVSERVDTLVRDALRERSEVRDSSFGLSPAEPGVQPAGEEAATSATVPAGGAGRPDSPSAADRPAAGQQAAGTPTPEVSPAGAAALPAAAEVPAPELSAQSTHSSSASNRTSVHYQSAIAVLPRLLGPIIRQVLDKLPFAPQPPPAVASKTDQVEGRPASEQSPLSAGQPATPPVPGQPPRPSDHRTPDPSAPTAGRSVGADTPQSDRPPTVGTAFPPQTAGAGQAGSSQPPSIPAAANILQPMLWTVGQALAGHDRLEGKETSRERTDKSSTESRSFAATARDFLRSVASLFRRDRSSEKSEKQTEKTTQTVERSDSKESETATERSVLRSAVATIRDMAVKLASLLGVGGGSPPRVSGSAATAAAGGGQGSPPPSAAASATPLPPDRFPSAPSARQASGGSIPPPPAVAAAGSPPNDPPNKLQAFYAKIGVQVSGGGHPDHYTLLGVRRDETNTRTIESKAERLYEEVRKYQLVSPEEASAVQSQIARAVDTLTNPQARASYDRALPAGSADSPQIKNAAEAAAALPFAPATPPSPSGSGGEPARSAGQSTAPTSSPGQAAGSTAPSGPAASLPVAGPPQVAMPGAPPVNRAVRVTVPSQTERGTTAAGSSTSPPQATAAAQSGRWWSNALSQVWNTFRSVLRLGNRTTNVAGTEAETGLAPGTTPAAGNPVTRMLARAGERLSSAFRSLFSFGSQTSATTLRERDRVTVEQVGGPVAPATAAAPTTRPVTPGLPPASDGTVPPPQSPTLPAPAGSQSWSSWVTNLFTRRGSGVRMASPWAPQQPAGPLPPGLPPPSGGLPGGGTSPAPPPPPGTLQKVGMAILAAIGSLPVSGGGGSGGGGGGGSSPGTGALGVLGRLFGHGGATPPPPLGQSMMQRVFGPLSDRYQQMLYYSHNPQDLEARSRHDFAMSDRAAARGHTQFAQGLSRRGSLYGMAAGAAQVVQGARKGDEGVGDAVSGAGSMLMGASAFLGPFSGAVGAVTGGLLKVTGAILKAGEGVQRWTENLHSANMQFAEFSAAMAGVAAQQRARDIMLSRERGDRRAQSAEFLAEGKSDLARSLAPIQDAFANGMNYVGGAVAKGFAAVLKPLSAILEEMQDDKRPAMFGEAQWMFEEYERIHQANEEKRAPSRFKGRRPREF